jgi:hypothetical protein
LRIDRAGLDNEEEVSHESNDVANASASKEKGSCESALLKQIKANEGKSYQGGQGRNIWQ